MPTTPATGIQQQADAARRKIRRRALLIDAVVQVPVVEVERLGQPGIPPLRAHERLQQGDGPLEAVGGGGVAFMRIPS